MAVFDYNTAMAIEEYILRHGQGLRSAVSVLVVGLDGVGLCCG